MKTVLALVFEYDAADWAHEYDLPQADVAADFAAVLRRAVDDGGIQHILDTNWPMMRGHATVHTLDGLDPTLRDELLHQLERARDASLDTALIAEVRDHLGAHPHDLNHREPRWVTFHTDEWDNGHFLTGSLATVYFPEGDQVAVDFDGTSVDDLLTDLYGARGGQAALGVDLHRQTLTFDDYGDNVPALMGIPANDHHDRDGDATDHTDHTAVGDGVEVSITHPRHGGVVIGNVDQR